MIKVVLRTPSFYVRIHKSIFYIVGKDNGRQKKSMMKNPFSKNRSILFSWLLSYILIMIIIIAINSLVYINTISEIENETDKAYMASLKQMQQSIDNILFNIENMSAKISLDSRISSLIRVEQPLSEVDTLKIAEAIDDLKKYQVANSFIKDIYIYMKNGDYIISSTAKYEPEVYFGFYYKDSEIQYKSWLELIKDKHFQEYLMLPGNNISNKNSNTIIFMHSISRVQRNSNDAVLAIEIDMNAIRNSMESLQWISHSKTIIQDQNNNFVSTKDIELPQELFFNNLDKSQDSFKYNINNENSIVSYMGSGITDWKYVTIIPASIFLERVKYSYNIFFFFILSCIIIGGLLAYYLAKRNYLPVGKIIGIINKSGTERERTSNEYEFIEKSINDIIHDKDKIYDKLNQQNDILKNNFLSKLMKGRLDQAIDTESILSEYDIKLDGKYFGVILLYIEDFTNLYLDMKEMEMISGETIDTVYFIIRKVFSERLGQKGRCYTSIINDIPACLINLDTDDSAAKHELYESIKSAKDTLENQYRIILSISTSNLHSSLRDVPQAYQEALEVMEYKLLDGINRIITYDEVYMQNKNYKELNNHNTKEQQFRNCISAGDYKSAKVVLSEMFRSYFNKNSVSIQMVKCRMFGLINVILNTMAEFNTATDNKYMEDMNMINILFKCKTTNELESNMLYILDRMDSYFDNKKTDIQNGIIKDMFEYINENISSEDLCVSMIAEKYNMSIIALSKFFKKHTSKGMLDYINQLRVDKATELLKDEKLGINEIGKKVGFYNGATFIRVFKKYQGTTPGKYRDSSSEY